MSNSIVFAALFMAAGPGLGVAHPLVWPRGLSLQGPQIELWTNRGDGTVYHRGERVRVFFRAEEDAYVTILRVDTDGRVRVLFPLNPWDDNFARGGRAYEIRPRELRYAFAIDEYPGQGYVFAIATRDPFDYREIARGDHWDYQALADGGRVTGDPYVAVQDLADLIVPANYDSYGYDLATYFVEQHYDYPRFLCYDCHAYVGYTDWNPYHYSCVRFRIVVYDDPYYYPARVYPANRVVYRRVARIEPRYVFTDRTATDAYVVRVRQRPIQPTPRRAGEVRAAPDPGERGVRGRDLGGVGTIPTPVRAPASAALDAPASAPGRRPDPLGQLQTERVPGQPTPRTLEPSPDRRPVGEPATEPRRVPEPAAPADPPRTPSGITVAVPDRPGQIVPRVEPRTAPERRVPAQTSETERPKLERREPQERTPVVRSEPQRPAVQARPPAAKPQAPAAKPATSQPKKPETSPPRRKPEGEQPAGPSISSN